MTTRKDPRLKKIDPSLEPNTLELFIQLTANQDWKTTRELRELLDDSDFWSQAFIDRAEESAKEARIRRMIKLIKEEEDGFPLFQNLRIPLEDGSFEHIWKQYKNFTKDDFKQVAHDMSERANTDLARCHGLNRRYFKKYKVQLSFSFMYEVKLPDPSK
jgi:hypothetical protein